MNPRASSLLLFVDLDDTLYRTNERRVERIAEDLGDEFANIYLSGDSGEDSDSIDHREALPILKSYCRELDHDPEFYTALPLVPDALPSLQEMENAEGVAVCAYVSARPIQLASLTSFELFKYGFPSAPVICRPEYVPRRDAADWKLSYVLQDSLLKDMSLIIDNDPAVSLRIQSYGLKGVDAICYSEAQNYHHASPNLRYLDWPGILEYVLDVL